MTKKDNSIIQVYPTKQSTFMIEITTFPKDPNLKIHKQQISVNGNKWKTGVLEHRIEEVYTKIRECITKLHLESEKMLQ